MESALQYQYCDIVKSNSAIAWGIQGRVLLKYSAAIDIVDTTGIE
jgi:hypothetical protein